MNEFNHKLQQAIKAVMERRHRLIIGKAIDTLQEQQLSEVGGEAINVNAYLSEKLLDIPRDKQSRTVAQLIAHLIKQYDDKQILAFSRFEILFLPELQQDPLRLFEELSKEHTILLFWPGKYEAGVLSYAEPWHREFREYAKIDAIIL